MITSSRPLARYVAGGTVLQMALWADASLVGVTLMFLGEGGFQSLGLVILPAGLLAFLLPVPMGVLVDRAARRSALVWSGVAGAVALGSLAVAALAGAVTTAHVTLAIGAVTLVAVTGALALEAYLPAVTGRHRFVPVNAWLYGIASVGTFGFAVTTGLPSTAAVVVVLVVPAVGFAVSALLFRYVDVPEDPAPPREGVWPEAVAGVRFTLRHPVLAAIAGYLVALAALGQLIDAPRPDGLADGWDLVTMLAPPLVGAPAAVMLHRRVGALRLAWFAVLATQPFALLLAFPSGAAGYVLGHALPLAGAATAAIALLSHRQAITPPRLLGRSGGTLVMLVALAATVGSVLETLLALAGAGRSWLAVPATAGVLAAAVPLLRASRSEPPADADQGAPAT
ncbi:hypothetical protein [Nonomuraea harbinensis]|uniref:MFS transporter n=1 Tax=Nonomuraea harbinensis TaxID=1286938 RepID=A0ABW1BT39_9ACTN|nr:hypothetical protein [Nonomuraea harbinensis]